MNDPLSRRQALGVLAAPFLAACFPDRLTGPGRSKLSAAALTDRVSLIGAGDPHAAAYKTTRAVSKVGTMIRQALEADPNAAAFALGDLVPTGTVEEYQTGYAPMWGPFLDRTFCVLGNHDRVADRTATAYYDYVGERGGPRGRGFYAVNLGDWWRSYFMNSEQWHDAQTTWLRADLAEWQGKRHILAVWHTPLFASVCEHNGKAMTWPWKLNAWWQVLQEHGVECVISGHVHRYERFPRMLRNGSPSAQGLRQFIVGTGGAGNMPIRTVHPLSQSQVITRGMARFDLYPDRYEWSFIDMMGVKRDWGRQVCRQAVAV
jgi:acid phosphatase type 7